MFAWTPRQNDALDEVIDDALSQLAGLDIEHDKYTETVTNVEKLMKLKAEKARNNVSPDTIVTVLANLAGIMLILQHERAHVVASKALTILPKFR